MSQLEKRTQFDPQGRITALDLSELGLTSLPGQIEELSHLKRLDLSRNRLTNLPPQIANLTSLQELDLSENGLTVLSPKIGQLANLQYLSLWGNDLTDLAPEIASLTSLQELDLSENHLESLPPQVGHLTNLRYLYLWDNNLTAVPPEIGHLKNLQILYLSGNHLEVLAPEISQLGDLQELDLSRNRLTVLPPGITQLAELQSLTLTDNPLRTPPPEIVARGQNQVFDFMRELAQGHVARFEAKLLMVGEGGTGKSSLLRALRHEPFIDGLPTTHGVDIQPYALPHPRQPGETMTLNVWDFGGQQIYHTTHQFFLTRRSLYLLVWSARGDADQGRLDHWLRKITVLAPGAPIILVATHIDQRPADLNYRRFQEAYPQITGHVGVSNKDGTGIDDLKNRIACEAAKLPLMEQRWPTTWVAAEDRLRETANTHLSLTEYTTVCAQAGISDEVAQTAFGGYLHDLGKILYYHDDDTLSDFVVLRPKWLTQAISRVLDDDQTRDNGGILAHTDFSRIWDRDEHGQVYERRLHLLFLRLMERYLISFKIESPTPDQQATHSLVPLLLPHDPPTNLLPWTQDLPNKPEINMVFRLPHFVPPGLMSWFIVLTHRYTQASHWREGVRLAYEGHQAEVVLNSSKRELWLRVRGPAPSNFFNILQHTINDRIFKYYFEDLDVQRQVPCNCHLERGDAAPCPYFHDYERLAERLKRAKLTAECGSSFQEVSVPLLLEGIHYTTDDRVAEKLEATQRILQKLLVGQDSIVEITSENQDLLVQNAQMFEQLNRGFTRLWNLQMAGLNAECPNTFILMPGDRSLFDPKNLFSTEYTLYLMCQNPTGPHIVRDEPGYTVPQAREWWVDLAPWLGRLVDFVRYIPKVRGVAEAYGDSFFEDIDTSLGIFKAMLEELAPIADGERLSQSRSRFEAFAAEGPALRALHSFLTEADKKQRWCGLHRTATNDGNIFWLCPEHQRLYQS